MFDTLPRIHTFFVKRNKPTSLYAGLLLVALVGYLDYVTGFEVSISFLYLVPISLVTWYVNSRAGYLVTFMSISTWILSNWAAGETYTREIFRYWNASTRLVVFILVIWLLQEFKRALAHERMLSQTDYLTGIANNREFYQQILAELRRASRSKRPISLAYIDLDGFKQVNDRLGHRRATRCCGRWQRPFNRRSAEQTWLPGWAAMSLRSYSPIPVRRAHNASCKGCKLPF